MKPPFPLNQAQTTSVFSIFLLSRTPHTSHGKGFPKSGYSCSLTGIESIPFLTISAISPSSGSH